MRCNPNTVLSDHTLVIWYKVRSGYTSHAKRGVLSKTYLLVALNNTVTTFVFTILSVILSCHAGLELVNLGPRGTTVSSLISSDKLEISTRKPGYQVL